MFKRIVTSVVAVAATLLFNATSLAAEPAKAPPADTIQVDRVKVKPGQMDAFKAGIVAHQKKYHSGKWAWRVLDILTGPDAGGFLIVEGPNSWTDIEDRGDLGDGHQQDWAKNFEKYSETAAPTAFLTYRNELSTSVAVAMSPLAATETITPKPFKGAYVYSSLKLMQKAWEKMGWSVGVWSTSRSGKQQFMVSYRFQEGGFKNFDKDGPSTADVFNDIHGEGSWSRTMEGLADAVEARHWEMVRYNKDLSSK